jgi:hypothetical protein
MREAARDVLAALDPAQRDRAMFPMDSDERTQFFFVPMPGERKGLPLKDMTADQRRLVHGLLRSVMSHPGYTRASGVLLLEQILGVIENNPTYRDPGLYYLSLFGHPDGDGPWGWRFEGHHLSLNFSTVSNEVAIAPAFFGSNPAMVMDGPYAGLRIHADLEDTARELLASLDAGDRARAVIAAEAPRDIVTSNKREASLAAFEGLPLASMDAPQQAILWQLVEAYAGNAEPDVARRLLDRFRATPADSLFFAWAGPGEVGAQHYYRIHAPTLLIEYDNTQGNGNHVHSVIRDLTDDFGEDMLRRHYESNAH